MMQLSPSPAAFDVNARTADELRAGQVPTAAALDPAANRSSVASEACTTTQ